MLAREFETACECVQALIIDDARKDILQAPGLAVGIFWILASSGQDEGSGHGDPGIVSYRSAPEASQFRECVTSCLTRVL